MSNKEGANKYFFGSATYKLDEKGRVTVPPDWRIGTEENVFYLVPDSKGECVRAMREDRYMRFADEARSLPGMTAEKHRMFMRNFYSKCAKTATDSQFRITIPKTYCEQLKLEAKDELLLIGTGDLFEVWKKLAHEAQETREAEEYSKFAGALGL